MTHAKDDSATARGQPRYALRVTLTWDGLALSITRVSRVAMRAPAPIGEPPTEGQVGFWIELRDRNDRVRYHRVMQSPIRTHVEIFSPTRIEALPTTPQPTEFDVVVPDLDDARNLMIWSSPFEPTRTLAPAQVLGQFNLQLADRDREKNDERG